MTYSALFIFFCAALLFGHRRWLVLSRRRKFRYRTAGTLLTQPEAIFYNGLAEALRGEWTIAMKVRIADLLAPNEFSSRRYRSAFYQVSNKHVDFVLLNKQFKAVAAIELDDRSHARADRQLRDRIVEHALATAGLPLIRVKVQQRYRWLAILRAVHDATTVGKCSTLLTQGVALQWLHVGNGLARVGCTQIKEQ